MQISARLKVLLSNDILGNGERLSSANNAVGLKTLSCKQNEESYTLTDY